MNQPEIQIILLDYLTSVPKESFKRRMLLEYPQYSQKQWEVLIEKLDSFTSQCNENSVILSFPYVWNQVKEASSYLTKNEIAALLWNKDYQKSGISKKQLGQMCMGWFRFEKQFIEFTNENQKLLDIENDKEQEL